MSNLGGIVRAQNLLNFNSKEAIARLENASEPHDVNDSDKNYDITYKNSQDKQIKYKTKTTKK